MSRKLLLVLLVGFSMASIGCCNRCADPYGYSSPVFGAPVSSGCSSCATTPAITTYSAPSPTLAPGQ
jgi:hypothetical protein